MSNEMILSESRDVQILDTVYLLHRVERIREIQAKVMKEGVDYGTIPGCGDKPTLLKPGAETLLMAFEMAALPDQMSIQDLGGDDEVRYRVVAPIYHVPTNRLCGNGVGECSSMEEKYKWRKAICDEEFNETDPERRRLKYYKDGGTAKQIRTNKADVANTILKMSKKRALVDGALTVTAASRTFSQDLEEIPEEMRNGDVGASRKKKAAPSNEMCVPNYGPDAGMPFSQVKIDHLKDYLAGANRSILDPKKANFIRKNAEMRDALKVEIAKREHPLVQPETTVQGDGAGQASTPGCDQKPSDASAPKDEDVFTAASLMLDYQTIIAEGLTPEDIHTCWDAARESPVLDKAQKAELYKLVQARLKKVANVGK